MDARLYNDMGVSSARWNCDNFFYLIKILPDKRRISKPKCRASPLCPLWNPGWGVSKALDSEAAFRMVLPIEHPDFAALARIVQNTPKWYRSLGSDPNWTDLNLLIFMGNNLVMKKHTNEAINCQNQLIIGCGWMHQFCDQLCVALTFLAQQIEFQLFIAEILVEIKVS